MRNVRTAGLALSAGLIGYFAGAWKINVAEAAKDPVQVLMELDREFDETVAERGSEGWASYFAEDGIMLPAGGNVVVGKQAVRELMSQSFADPNFKLRWEPLGADVSGNLGYTYGLSQMSLQGRDGKPVVAYGKYVTIWKKQRDKSWKIAVDIGNPRPAPEKTGVERRPANPNGRTGL